MALEVANHLPKTPEEARALVRSLKGRGLLSREFLAAEGVAITEKAGDAARAVVAEPEMPVTP